MISERVLNCWFDEQLEHVTKRLRQGESSGQEYKTWLLNSIAKVAEEIRQKFGIKADVHCEEEALWLLADQGRRSTVGIDLQVVIRDHRDMPDAVCIVVSRYEKPKDAPKQIPSASDRAKALDIDMPIMRPRNLGDEE